MSDRLGHVDVAFTLQVYTHAYDEQRVEAAVPLVELLAAPGRRTMPDAPSEERSRGVAALLRLRRALDALLRDAPPWTKDVALGV